MVESNTDTLPIKKLSLSYFPDCQFTDDSDSLETIDKSEIFYRKQEILSYLQTMFFEEQLVEFQNDQGTRIFFGSILDELPQLIEEKDELGQTILVEPDHEPGEYLKKCDSFLLSPLTPSIGNAVVRNANKIVARFFSGTLAIELGCAFREQTLIHDQPVLRLNFPEIGRVNRNYRTYRVKTGTTCDASAELRYPGTKPDSETFCFPIYDVSSGGIALSIPEEKQLYSVGQLLIATTKVAGRKDLVVNGMVRNLVKVREKSGYRYLCGIQIDLETRALATELEKLAAHVQRIHLRELAEKTGDMENVTLVR